MYVCVCLHLLFLFIMYYCLQLIYVRILFVYAYIGELIHDLEIVKIVKKLGLYCIHNPHTQDTAAEPEIDTGSGKSTYEGETLNKNPSSAPPSVPSDVITVFIHKSALSYTDPESDKDIVVTEDNITKLFTIGNVYTYHNNYTILMYTI